MARKSKLLEELGKSMKNIKFEKETKVEDLNTNILYWSHDRIIEVLLSNIFICINFS